jgi:hypothetical protein
MLLPEHFAPHRHVARSVRAHDAAAINRRDHLQHRRKQQDRHRIGKCWKGQNGGNRGEIARILRNEELRVREGKPLKRTVLHESCEWEGERVDITTGEAEYTGWDTRLRRQGVESSLTSWGHNDKFIRVVWEKSAAK